MLKNDRGLRGGVLAALAGLLLLAWCVPSAAVGEAGPSSPAASRSLKEIYELYFSGLVEQGMGDLSDKITSGRLVCNRKCLEDTVLFIMKDYFTNFTRPQLFENLIKHLIDAENKKLVRDFFLNTDLYENVQNAFRDWEMPHSIKVIPAKMSIGMTESVKVEYVIKNNLGKVLDGVKPEVTITPTDIGEYNSESKRFRAHRDGSAEIQMKAGQARGSAVISISPLPGPLVESVQPDKGPVGMEISIKGQNFGSTTEGTNVFFDKVKAPVEAAQDTLLKLKIPSSVSIGERKLVVQTPYGENEYPKMFTIVPLPEKPSRLWAYVSSGVFVASGGFYIFETMNARDKSDECDQLAADYDEAVAGDAPDAETGRLLGEWNKCKEDYDGIHTLEQVGLGFVAASAIATGYFWYRYFKENGEYNEKMREIYGGKKIGLAPHRGGIAVTYRF